MPPSRLRRTLRDEPFFIAVIGHSRGSTYGKSMCRFARTNRVISRRIGTLDIELLPRLHRVLRRRLCALNGASVVATSGCGSSCTEAQPAKVRATATTTSGRSNRMMRAIAMTGRGGHGFGSSTRVSVALRTLCEVGAQASLGSLPRAVPPDQPRSGTSRFIM